ncbi:hypothetical protein GDO81_020829 [Engystomops pustulosus]|uniref:Uncharacterized protein n=2 Tax=Engystomops pustulosus TaxID=76066 RepID=A0AAV6ZHV5_ENGPU|nr:hypothetical protein GDO81_020829 [Engystomops pustulosus]KAG8545459.1 hypothetical protein GDO81_020829 [Engystomops pustulosus]
MPRGEHTDFPSLEEGTLLSETDGRRVFSAGQPHLVQLELQDSCLSPCLPLLTTDSSPAHKFFEDTLFQKTGVEHFAPLRAELDVSEFPGHPPQLLQMSDVVELTSKEITMDQGERSISLSQHYMRETIGDNKDVEGLQPLSASCEEREDKILSETESAVVKPTSSDNIIQPVVDNKDLRSDDGAFLSSSVPAPVLLELLEKEVGMSSSSGRSSRRSSKSSTTGGTENVHGKNLEPAPEQQNLSSLDPGAQLHLKTTSHQTLEETFIDSSEIDFFKDAEKEMENSGQLNRSGITLRHMKPQSTQPSRDALHKQLCSEIQQRRQEKVVEDAAKSGRETMGDGSPRVHVTSPSEPKVDNTAEARSRDELSMSSRCSIERGHKDTEISQTGNTPVDETSFIGRLPHPISQSTPGTFTMNLKPLSGRIQQIKAKLTGSDMSLNEDPSAESAARNSAPTAVPQSIQSSQGYPESSDSQRSLSPQRRRIQSLPSLNYIEKVGAWNTNQSFDALVLRGLTGVSPKKLAYNAVADSLNRMLSRQTSSTAAPRKELAASFKATSSMTNLSLAERESSTSTITRSQSYNSVLPGRDQNQEEAAKSKTSQSSLRGSSSIQDISSRGPAAGDLHLLTKPTSSEYQDTSHRRPEKACNTSRNQSRNFVTMDRFSDVSSDQDYASASLSSSHEKEMLVKALTSAKQDLTEGEGSHDWSPPEDTSGKEQLDIEERIPTYLRNLGIDQSPTAILTPFAPQGPIREPEFSPTELRTIKGSTATPSRSMRLSEGGSQSAVNISQSSLYSSTSTTSVSIPMGSDIGPESPLPEISPQFGFGSTADRPISQDDTMPRGVSSDLAAPAAHEEMSPAIKDLTLALEGSINEDNVELTRVKQLIDQFESGRPEEITSHDVKDASLQDYTQKLPPMDPVNDSFVGSKTLKEIQKLFAEAENIGLDRSGSSLHRVSPVGDPYTMAPTRSLNLEDSLNSRSATPLDLLVKDMSWDSSFNSSFTRDPSVTKDSSVTSLPSSSVRDQSYLGELIKNRNTLAVPLTDWGRSEPEGSCKATSEKMMPSTSVIKRRDLVDVAEKMERSQQLLSSVSSSVGDLRNALAFTGTGYIRGRETESDESSGDSLAARVTSLLRKDAMVAVRAMSCAEEEERQARGSVKLKLTSHQVMPDTELSEEDRRRIDEIKRELLEGAKQKRPVRTTGKYCVCCASSPHDPTTIDPLIRPRFGTIVTAGLLRTHNLMTSTASSLLLTRSPLDVRELLVFT